jgi:hypothetical protein
VGPVDTDTWLAFAPVERGLGLAVSMAITAPLLAAAVEWLVAPREEEVDLSEEAAGARSPAG